MKTIHFFTILILIAGFAGFAKSDVLIDDFETYSAGDLNSQSEWYKPFYYIGWNVSESRSFNGTKSISNDKDQNSASALDFASRIDPTQTYIPEGALSFWFLSEGADGQFSIQSTSNYSLCYFYVRYDGDNNRLYVEASTRDYGMVPIATDLDLNTWHFLQVQWYNSTPSAPLYVFKYRVRINSNDWTEWYRETHSSGVAQRIAVASAYTGDERIFFDSFYFRNPTPVLISPNNEAVLNAEGITFEWLQMHDAIGYELRADDDCSFNSPEIDSQYLDGARNTKLSIESPFPDGTYCWQVRAKFGEDDYSEWSEKWQFDYNHTTPPERKISAIDNAYDDMFGFAVSISDHQAIVGAPNDDDNGADSGSAYIFRGNGGIWHQAAKLTANDGETEDRFGYSVSIYGDEAVVGAYLDDDNGEDSGSAYIFKKIDGVWTETAKLTASDGVASDYFGISVSISNDRAIIGAYRNDVHGDNSGAAYIFEKAGGVWMEVAKTTAFDGEAGDLFGYSVSISGDQAIVGAYGDDDNGDASGSTYLFAKTGGTWAEAGKLTPLDGSFGDNFGGSVAISGNRIIVGAERYGVTPVETGSAYIFEKTGGEWLEAAKLLPSNSIDARFGISVSIHNDQAIVGAYGDDYKDDGAGAVYIFKKINGSWTETAKLTASDGEAVDLFGYSVSISGDQAIAGAYGDDDAGNKSGSAYLFDIVRGEAGPLLIAPGDDETLPPAVDLTFAWSPVANAIGYEIRVDNDLGFNSPEINNQYVEGGDNTSIAYQNPLPDGAYSWQARAKFGEDDFSEWSEVRQFTYQLFIGSEPVWTPLYRLYKGGEQKDHFYTTNARERDDAVASGAGWSYERIECSISSSNAPGMVPLFRLYHASAGYEDHFYTTNETERDNAISLHGYTYEGITGFVYPASVEGSVALYRLNNPTDKNHFYCTRTSERDYALNHPDWNFQEEGIACYVKPAETPVPLSSGRPSGYHGSVNTAIGAYRYSHTDVRLPSPGPSIRFTRSYNSRSTNEGILGIGWKHSYDWRIYEAENLYVIHRGNGNLHFFDGAFEPLYGGVYDALSRDGDVLTLTTPDKKAYTFEYMSESAEDRKRGFFLTGIMDRNGNALTIEYTAGRLSKITDPVNRTIDFSYDASGHLQSITDPRLNRSLTFRVDPESRNLESSTDWKGNETTYLYEEDEEGGRTHRLVSIVRPGGKTLVTNEYDAEGRLIKRIDALGKAAEFTYDGDGAHVLDALGNTTTYKNSIDFELEERVDANGHVELFGYNNGDDAKNAHEPTHFTDRRGHLTEFRRIESTNNIEEVIHTIENNDTVATHFDYDNQAFPSFPTASSNPLSKTTTYTHDGQGNVTRITDPSSKTIQKTFNDHGQVAEVTDKNNKTTHYYYEDAWKNLTRVVDPLGGETTYTHDAAGRRLTMTDPRGFTTAYEYDLNDNVTKIIDPLQNETTYEYDENDNLIKITAADNHETTFTHDLKDRVLTITDANNATRSYTYDALGRRASVTDANGKTTTYEYDGNGNPVKVVTPLSTLEYRYDENDNLVKIIDARQKETTNAFTHMDQLAHTENPLGKTTHYSYWKDGNIFTRLRPDGALTEYFYDDVGRLTTISYPDASGVAFTYDAKGNLTGLTDAAGASTYVYDANDRLTSVTDPFGKTVTYAYDAAGNRTSVTYPGSKLVTYGYDELNRLKTVMDWLDGVTTYHYDAVGAVTRVDHPNGTQSFYTHDPGGRLIGLSNKRGDDSVICEYAYTLDNNGNITNTDRNEPLVPVFHASTASYTYNDANQIVSDAEHDYAYDAKGNLIQRNKTGEATSFTYNFENMLTTISGSHNTINVYNGLGQRISRSIDGVETRYVLDAAASLPSVLMETDSSGNPKAYYIYGLGLTCRIASDGARLVYHFNHRGDAIALTDGNGSVTDAYAYDEFGKVTDSTGVTENPFKYVGRYGVMDEGDGFLFMRARYYDANIGRFLSKDPIGFQGGDLNLYAYASINPVMGVDPRGLQSCSSPIWCPPVGYGQVAVVNYSIEKLELLEKSLAVVLGCEVAIISIGAVGWYGGPLIIKLAITHPLEASEIGLIVLEEVFDYEGPPGYSEFLTVNVLDIVFKIKQISEKRSEIMDSAKEIYETGKSTYHEVTDAWKNAWSNIKWSFGKD